ncbi:hypothetical protein P7G58_04290 [Globicatella sulfidifaciens]|uniref:hypothetical protein n=1 Tax=Globicatella sulfidifaciens TaxID=136093 RepID=UPI00288D7830|nr:hypothetical protein [Globicatella sulfidifaciens]MDT2768081.1 hypothetical protein [Globicatella sulfidifaciens]
MNQDVVIIKEEQTFFDKIKGYLYLSPAIIILSLFMFWPFIQTLYRSMFLTNNMGANVEFLGLGNYIELLGSDSFWSSVKTSFVFVVIVVVVGVTIGFLTALLCQKSFPGVKFFLLPMQCRWRLLLLEWR